MIEGFAPFESSEANIYNKDLSEPLKPGKQYKLLLEIGDYPPDHWLDIFLQNIKVVNNLKRIDKPVKTNELLTVYFYISESNFEGVTNPKRFIIRQEPTAQMQMVQVKRLELYEEAKVNLVKDFKPVTSSKYTLGTWRLYETIITNQKYRIHIETTKIDAHQLNVYVSNGTNNEWLLLNVPKVSDGIYEGIGSTNKEVNPAHFETSMYQYPNSDLETITVNKFEIYMEEFK